eukprot:CAMPEP_0196749916 /NCGR_PEP_ID=MMETSP1091-20130531/78840_1 /TAXON_ID=302021 /ORGANISM="Rhodomonas sp., Strain CCMP768" /LENGTH=65 /DNA_ID=CAMNT_0042097471 /DNA_START=81 /DNA_END=274 /DNA_ORIENTATION=+
MASRSVRKSPNPSTSIFAVSMRSPLNRLRASAASLSVLNKKLTRKPRRASCFPIKSTKYGTKDLL